MNLNTLLDKYKIKADIKVLLEMWNEKNRYYHNLNHLTDLCEQITNDYLKNKLNQVTMEKLLLTSLFHDIIYDLNRDDNENKSAEFFLSLCIEKNNIHILDIKQAILDTKTHEATNYLSEKFNYYDMNIVERNYEKLLEWEEGIYNEYKVYGDDKYKMGRLQFLESLIFQYPKNSDNINKLIEYVKVKY